MRFTLYFLGYEERSDIPADIKERTAWTFSRRATLELTQCVRAQRNRVILCTDDQCFYFSVWQQLGLRAGSILVVPQQQQTTAGLRWDLDNKCNCQDVAFLSDVYIFLTWKDYQWGGKWLNHCQINWSSSKPVVHAYMLFVSGHIGISVPDVDDACKYFEKEKVTFVKRPDSGETTKLASLVTVE